MFDTYYRYNGSLTTPGCNESVQWSVFSRPLTVTQETAAKMALMSKATAFEDNWRHTQELNERKVLYFEPSNGAAPLTTVLCLGLWLLNSI